MDQHTSISVQPVRFGWDSSDMNDTRIDSITAPRPTPIAKAFLREWITLV